MATLEQIPEFSVLSASGADFVDVVRILHDSARVLLGAGLCWKDADREYRAAMPSRLVAHDGPYCMALKNEAELQALCVDDCLVEKGVDFWKSRPGGRAKTCHGQVMEFVAPAFSGDDFMGVLHIGPFRLRARPDVPACAAPFLAALPTFERASVVAFAEMALQTVELAASRRDVALRLRALSGEEHPAVHTAIALLESKGRVDLRVAHAAEAAHISESRLVHLLKEVTGKSFTALRTDAAMRRSRRLLADEDRHVADVATALGYANPNKFTSAFKRYHGASPSEYRQQLLWSSAVGV